MSDDEPMRRTSGVRYEPDSRADVLDFVVDYAHDAADADVHPKVVASALREAADELDERAAREAQEQDTPARSEPADFGGGESTGVQNL